MDMIELDGSAGGGQLLRTALSLSLCTGTGFTMDHIRARRSKPGLMRQHLTAVNAAAQVGCARVSDVSIGATRLRFEPGVPQAGDYHFAIGSAGSTTLLLQTLLPALWQCGGPSRIRLEGGTHNPLAPSADFLADTFLPVLAQVGIDVKLQLERHGFYPAGGGVLCADVNPCASLQQVLLEDRGELQSITATALLSALPSDVGHRELAVVAQRLGLAEDALGLHAVRPALGPGNALLVQMKHAHHTETFTGYGERGLPAESVASRVCDQVRSYLDAGACVGEHLADQLLLPMALAGGGVFTTTKPTDHLRSNAALIEKFLPVEISSIPLDGIRWRVIVSR